MPQIKCGTVSAPTGVIKVVTEAIKLEAMSINLVEVTLFHSDAYCYCQPLTWPIDVLNEEVVKFSDDTAKFEKSNDFLLNEIVSGP